ncbi:FAD-dependent oxidoreductase [bacterium]|nr:FAD-dependent oxidoreductase [bacterium]
MYELIIIGGGPAGITAGIYSGRQKIRTLLITKTFGGQITQKAVMIENYPGFEKISGRDLIQKFERHLKRFDIEIKMDEVTEVKKSNGNFLVITKDKSVFESRAVILASGSDPRRLEIPGEKEFLGKGVSYCPTCDGPLFSNKVVAIIGGGNVAFEAALYLSGIVKKVYILEFGEKVRADATNQELVKKTGKAEIITSAQTKEIRGDMFVKELVYEDRKEKREVVLPVDGVFIEIGLQPATSFIRDLVEFNERDEIIVDFETYQTKTPGLFAAGDCNIGKARQIITACGEGAKAAMAAFGYLRNLEK